MASGAVKTDWSRYELDDNGEFLTDDEGNLVEKTPEAPAEAPKKAGVTLMDALFPSRARAEKAGAPIPRQMLARAKDLATLGPAALYAGAETLTKGGSFKENLANREGGSIVKGIANDPATLPALAVTGGGSTVFQLAKAGLKQGLTSAAAHQAENVAEGREVDPGAAAAELTLSTLLPVAANKGGQALKSAGKGFMQSILKPSKFLRETEKIDMGELIETLGSKRPLKGSVSGMAKKATELEKQLGKQYQDVVAANAGAQIDVPAAVQGTKQQFADDFTKKKMFGDVIEGIEKGGEYWDDIVQRQGGGQYNLPEAINLRKSVGRAGRYNVNKDPRDLEGVTQFARSLYGDLSQREAVAVPDLAPIKKQLSSLYPLQEAVENAQGRTANNFYPGLTDNIALASAAQASRPEMSIPGLLLFLANRAVKNPSLATAAYQAGKGLQAPGPGQEAAREAVKRALAQSFRGESE